MTTVKDILRQRKQARTKIHEFLKAAAAVAHELDWTKDRFLTTAGFAFYMKGDVFADLSTLDQLSVQREETSSSTPEATITNTEFICDGCVSERGGITPESNLPHKLCLRHERMRDNTPPSDRKY